VTGREHIYSNSTEEVKFDINTPECIAFCHHALKDLIRTGMSKNADKTRPSPVNKGVSKL